MNQTIEPRNHTKLDKHNGESLLPDIHSRNNDLLNLKRKDSNKGSSVSGSSPRKFVQPDDLVGNP